MNFDKNKSDYSKLDDMNIKSHLNTSLEMSGISVSEDLIQRTLQAIKEQQSTTIEQELMLEVPPEEATPNDINKEGIFSIAGATADTIINQFQEICTLTVEQTVKITITDEINQTVLTLTEQEDKEAFYSIMEGYQFSSQAISHEDNLYYTIDIEGADDINYIIRIGAAMVVESVDGEVSSISGYRVHNQEELLRELNVLISKY